MYWSWRRLDEPPKRIVTSSGWRSRYFFEVVFIGKEKASGCSII